MSPSPERWGVPDFGTVVIRERVVELIRRLGTRPIVLRGSPGCGKSIAAASYASRVLRDTLWIDACGEFVSAEQVSARICGAYEPQTSALGDVTRLPADSSLPLTGLLELATAGRGICVVIDDQGANPSQSLVSELGLLARRLRGCSSQLIITTRSTSAWTAEALCDWGIISDLELAFDEVEADELVRQLGVPGGADQADLLALCKGHPALFAIMASQAASYGTERECERSSTLDAWLRRLILTQMSAGCRLALSRAAMIKSGSERELSLLGVADPHRALTEVAKVLPLLALTEDDAGLLSFRTHDLVDGFLADQVEDWGAATAEGHQAAVEILSARGDYVRAMRLVTANFSPSELADWVELHGDSAIAGGFFGALRGLLESIPVHLLVCRHRVLLVWAQLCNELGEFEEALGKCQAALTLAEHEKDDATRVRAAHLSLRCLCRCHRLDDAEDLASELMSSFTIDAQPALHAHALLCVGQARLTRGEDPRSVLVVLDKASRMPGDVDSMTRQTAITLSAIVRVLSEGDWLSAARRMSEVVAMPSQSVSQSVLAKGNLGLMLIETGRLGRARSMLRRAIQEAELYGLDVYVGAYTPPLGWLEVAAGHVDEGIRMMGEGIAQSERVGEDEEAQLDRVYLSTVLRAAGRTDESLAEAESAFERLSVADNMGFRRQAALEVAASLLALGDITAARAWTESIAAEGPPPNPYHRLRADMVLAEADRREGNLASAVKRIAAHKDYIRSENPNWQIAMYGRAFPELVGVIALAVRPKNLPAHMLRMVTPEHSEVVLMRTKSFMDDATWRDLGACLLGETEFARFIARDGLPLCHVRMFGGLEVRIGDRSVRERDWKKRKARLLFSMLMIERGRDVARDQIFEHLWPDMEEARAKSNLYVVWSAMKSALMDGAPDKGARCPYVESVGGVCRSIRETVRTDVDAFEVACAQAHEAEAEARSDDALRAYRQIADLYRGDLLPGDCYEDWFVNLREHYRSEFMDAMLRATEILLERNDPHTALIFVRRAIQHDQFREDLYQAALRCQIAAGQRSSAIDTYMQCRDKLCDELGLDPSAEMRALYDEILAMEERPNGVRFDPLSD
jgi:DNA-binding SARP family transcriptional activator/ATP/maltotriose-dependent transcriptional regulator MalT